MSRSSTHALLLAALAVILLPASGAGAQPAGQHGPHTGGTSPGSGRASGVMRVGLTVVAADAVLAPLPLPAQLGHPASPSAVLCRSDDAGYRECLTPFRGRVLLSRELASTRCIEDQNWGWREGAVWVDRGCSAVFIRQAAARGAPAA